MLTEIIIVIVFFCLAWYLLGGSGTTIIDGTVDGNKQLISKTDNITDFSYTCWIRIDDFGKYGSPKIIFVKGSEDLSVACPALLIDANTNTLLVKFDTFGSQETISVSSVPAKKWLHIGITCSEHEIKVYVNGIEYASKSLVNLPKTNTGPLISSPSGGFIGKLSNLQFFKKTLTYDEIVSSSKQTPSVNEPDQVFPPYFGVGWFKP
jgi:hypothetical protein